MNQKTIEKRSLLVSALMNLCMGLAGLIVYVITDLNFLLLEFSF